MENDDTLEEWLCTGSVAPLFPLLRQGLYHATSVEGYRGISREGFIRPWNGSFRAAYPKMNSHARYHGWISLFDFQTPTEEQCFQVREQWGEFFVKEKPVTVLINLFRETLASKIIPNEAVEAEPNYQERMRIPYVEVWYPEPISLSAVQSCVLVFPSKPVRYLKLKANEDGFREIDRILNEIEALIATGIIKILSARDRFMARIRQSS